jgi:hypothetical protein
MQMNFRVGEIRQTAAMIEMHVSKDNMANIIRMQTQALDLPEGRFLRVHWNVRYYLEQAHDSGRMRIISKARASIDQGQALICLNQGANGSSLQAGRPTGITGETIENMDRHSEITLHDSNRGYSNKSSYS